MGGRLAIACAALLLATGLALGAAPAAGPAEKAADKPATASATPDKPAAGSKAEDSKAPGSDAQFFAELGYKSAATAADAARAFAVLVSEGKETGADYEGARTYLSRRGVLPDGWLNSAKAEATLEKGHLARLVCRTLGIKGGMWMRLLGPLPRLALRECVYLELMAIGPEYQYVTGGELVGVIDRADRWRVREANRESPKAPAKPAAEAPKAPVKPTAAEVKK